MEEFHIIRPSQYLAPYVKQYWFLQTSKAVLTQQRIIPTGCISLIFHRADKMFSLTKDEHQPNAFICGQSTTYTDLVQTGDVNMIAIVFQPHGANAFFKMPMNNLYRNEIAISDLDDRELLDLQDQLFEISNPVHASRLIESFLLKRLYILKEHNHIRMSSVIRAINVGQTNINNLAEISCLSYN